MRRITEEAIQRFIRYGGFRIRLLMYTVWLIANSY